MKSRSFETFRDIGYYEESNMIQKEPSCFNGIVRVVKYKVTVEQIEEPLEVIQERIQKLWDERSNMHHYVPLRAIGKKYGMDLI